MKTSQLVWDERFMTMLTLGQVTEWSRDPNEGVAALVVSPDKRRISLGFNGLPRDYPETRDMAEEARRCLTRHAEQNAISNAGCDLTGWTMYVTKAPCLPCALDIHAARIVRVVSPPIREESRWANVQHVARRELTMMGVKVVHLKGWS